MDLEKIIGASFVGLTGLLVAVIGLVYKHAQKRRTVAPPAQPTIREVTGMHAVDLAERAALVESLTQVQLGQASQAQMIAKVLEVYATVVRMNEVLDQLWNMAKRREREAGYNDSRLVELIDEIRSDLARLKTEHSRLVELIDEMRSDLARLKTEHPRLTAELSATESTP